MDDTVGDLLNLRGVRLSEPVSTIEIVGFRCLGVAEKIPELEEEASSSVHVWHVPKAIIPVSIAEAERWLVDAPSGAHWILSEREFEERAKEILSSKMKIELWSPEVLSRWIGEAVLRGDLVAQIPNQSPSAKEIQDSDQNYREEKMVILSPIINLDEWCIQRGIEYVDAKPVLLQSRIWEINGALVSPDGVREEEIWRVLEDPWANRLEIHDSEQNLTNIPDLRLINAKGNQWLSDEDLRVMLVGILDSRRQKQDEAIEGSSVRSTMLEKWSFDSEGAVLQEIRSAIPGWLLDHEGGLELLHSRNGRTYDLSSFEAP